MLNLGFVRLSNGLKPSAGARKHDRNIQISYKKEANILLCKKIEHKRDIQMFKYKTRRHGNKNQIHFKYKIDLLRFEPFICNKFMQ